MRDEYGRLIDFSRNPFVSQVNFFGIKSYRIRPTRMGRNPFVSQVNFFLRRAPRSISPDFVLSQSLRKSGQFLRFIIEINVNQGSMCRNPFVSQVNFFLLLRVRQSKVQ